MNVLTPWPGGWWRLRDMIDYELAVIHALLTLAARDKASIVQNFIRMNQDAIAAGRSEAPFAYAVPLKQHDHITATKMLNILMQGGVELHTLRSDVTLVGQTLRTGDTIILLSQPCRPYLKDLFEPQRYRVQAGDSENVRPPHDKMVSALPLMMGVTYETIDEAFDPGLLLQVSSARVRRGAVTTIDDGGYLISHDANRSSILVNRVLDRGKKIYWLKNPVVRAERAFAAGAIYVREKALKRAEAETLAQGLSLHLYTVAPDSTEVAAYELNKFRLGVYQPWTVSSDAGWTRFVLQQFEFPFETLHNADFKSGKIAGYDALILPDLPMQEIINGFEDRDKDSFSPKLPVSYQGGISDEGVDNLRKFVNKGGTLIALNRACELAVEKLALPVEHVLKNIEPSGFFCSGALLKIKIDQGEPVAYGMPEEAVALFADSPVLRPRYWHRRTGVPAYYPDADLLTSGWIEGDRLLRGLPAILDVPFGAGRVVLLGFKVQHRAQTQGTYKLLFNAIHISTAKEVTLPEG
jgi:hypothetical protein